MLVIKELVALFGVVRQVLGFIFEAVKLDKKSKITNFLSMKRCIKRLK